MCLCAWVCESVCMCWLETTTLRMWNFRSKDLVVGHKSQNQPDTAHTRYMRRSKKKTKKKCHSLETRQLKYKYTRRTMAIYIWSDASFVCVHKHMCVVSKTDYIVEHTRVSWFLTVAVFILRFLCFIHFLVAIQRRYCRSRLCLTFGWFVEAFCLAFMHSHTRTHTRARESLTRAMSLHYEEPSRSCEREHFQPSVEKTKPPKIFGGIMCDAADEKDASHGSCCGLRTTTVHLWYNDSAMEMLSGRIFLKWCCLVPRFVFAFGGLVPLISLLIANLMKDFVMRHVCAALYLVRREIGFAITIVFRMWVNGERAAIILVVCVRVCDATQCFFQQFEPCPLDEVPFRHCNIYVLDACM